MVLPRTQPENSGAVKSAVSLQMPLRYLKGVGPERSKLLDRLELELLEDLFTFYPRRYEDRSKPRSLSAVTVGVRQCYEGTVTDRALMRRGGLSIFRVSLTGGRKTCELCFYNQPYLHAVFNPGTRVRLCGSPHFEGKKIVFIHPEYETVSSSDAPAESAHFGRIVPVYGLTEDLSQKALRSLCFRTIREHAGLFEENLPARTLSCYPLIAKADALRQIHFPDSFERLKAAYNRLVFEEFYLMQLAVGLRRLAHQKKAKVSASSGGLEKANELIESLPFALTQDQKKAVEVILRDMQGPHAMARLIQGDVGSGKTAVSAVALAFAAGSGLQGVLMAPTEVLANQHYFTLAQMMEPLGIRCAYVAGGMPPAERARVLQETQNGSAQIIIGTHALIEETVSFKNLGVVIVDEQHKFGVVQRAALRQKAWDGSAAAHFLLTTATPIPRTLAMTLYGDLDLSVIAEKPAGRVPVQTLWVSEARRPEILEFIKTRLAEGRQAYVICPMVDPKNELLKDVKQAQGDLQKKLAPYSVGVLHGRMPAAEKIQIMKRFKERTLEVLVSTVVIEVGVDVPNATMMVIENAERFGLAQLHQLRGRVGRGAHESICFLFSNTASPEAAERLRLFEATDSGFDLAEADMKMRGSGDLAGQRQHGFPNLQIGDLSRDAKILEAARKEAAWLLSADPGLKIAAHHPLRRSLLRRYPGVMRGRAPL